MFLIQTVFRIYRLKITEREQVAKYAIDNLKRGRKKGRKETKKQRKNGKRTRRSLSLINQFFRYFTQSPLPVDITKR